MKRWKGKLQTEKQYNRRLKHVENGKRRLKKAIETETEYVVEGRRIIIDLNIMSQHMCCSFCKEDLLLKNIKKEEKHGLASVFSVLCQNCLLINKVPTGAKHLGPTNKLLYDVNTKSALGKFIHYNFVYINAYTCTIY